MALFVGGRGTRLLGEESPVPKALVPIGGQPIIWHIMRVFAAGGINDFVLLLGHQGELIADYVRSLAGRGSRKRGAGSQGPQTVTGRWLPDGNEWRVVLCPTGVDTEKGERLRLARAWLEDEPQFLATYGDGLADIDVQALQRFHLSHGRLATVCAVRVHSQWGHLRLSADGRVRGIREKPLLRAWVNGGFFVFSRQVLDLLEPGDTLETGCLPRLAAAGELVAFRHQGFWCAMDTYKDSLVLNDMWERGSAPWRKW